MVSVVLRLRKRRADGSYPGNCAIGGPLVFSIALLLALGSLAGCGVKRTVSVQVPSRIREAKTATLEDLLSALKTYEERIETLSSSNLKVSFTSGKTDSGKLQEYKSAPGYVLLKRPDSLRLNIQNPITKTTIVELSSRGDEFSIWYPRENKYFVGRNSTKEFDLKGTKDSPLFTARPVHILEAILPHMDTVEDPDRRIAIEEDQDANAKYYVISFFETAGQKRLRPIRRVWIERSTLAVVKRQTFASDGSVASIITSSNLAPVDGLLLPLSIRIDRPAEGYSLEMQFKSWRMNADIPATAFILPPPPVAQKVYLKEKTRTENP